MSRRGRSRLFVVWCSCVAVCLAFGNVARATTDNSDATARGLGRVAASDAQRSGDKFAIVVGIDKYSKFSGMSSLNYAVADAVALADVLEADGYQVLRRFDSDANRRSIMRAIATVKEMAELSDKSDSTLLFSFSGHGFAVDNQNYLLTQDASRDDLVVSGLALSELQSELRGTGIARRMTFIDACRNDPNANARSASADSFVVDTKGEGEAILFSTRAGDFSYESPDLGQGVFSYYLVKGLGGEAARDGVVALQDIKSYLEKNVAFWTGKHIGEVQKPYVSGEYTGDFPLISKVLRQDPPPVTPPNPPEPEKQQPAVQPTVASNSAEKPRPAAAVSPDRVWIRPGRGTEFLTFHLESLFDQHDMAVLLDDVDSDGSALRLHTTPKGIYLEEEFGSLVVRGDVSVKLSNAAGKSLARKVFSIEGASLVHVEEAEELAAQHFANQIESSAIMRVIEKQLAE